MNKPYPTPAGETVEVAFDQLSKGIDRILNRWEGPDRPTKLALLNDLAAAISPGANWGALKAKAAMPMTQNAVFDAASIPTPDRGAHVLPARLSEVRSPEKNVELVQLIDEARPLFGLRHGEDRIVGLQLSVTDGNGFTDASIYFKLVLERQGQLHVQSPFADVLEPLVAQLIYNAIQNLNSVELYPTYAQSDCGVLRILLGPFDCAVAIPEFYGRRPDEDSASQGVKVLIEEGETPSLEDLDLGLRLASAAVPHLGLDHYPEDRPVRYKLTQPLSQVWKPVEFVAHDLLDDRPMFRKPGTSAWTHQDDFLLDENIWTHATLGEPLDLALALIDVDDQDVYLKVGLTPMPKQGRRAGKRAPNWRGGFHRDFQVLRIRPGKTPQELTLDPQVHERFQTGFVGWAIHEGHELVDDVKRVRAEALIPRDVRRASQHLRQVEAIINGADPHDKELLRRIRGDA
ncbi:MAG: hypothetical protein AAF225_13670 [Pseudomonadota bacterium]